MTQFLKTLEANTVGRDFIVGDMHGCLSLFEQFLQYIDFDPSKDRMISCGDLVDRGPDSLGCLRLLKNDWFHCVKANHEAMMIDALTGGVLAQLWEPNGGKWAMQYLIDARLGIKSELHELLPYAESLPFVLTLKLADGKRLHVIHAEFPFTKTKITDEALEDPEFIRNLASMECREGEFFMWGREVYYHFYFKPLDNVQKIHRHVYLNRSRLIFNDQLSHIVSGHSIMQKPLTIDGQTCIDTGAFESYSGRKWAGLTFVNANTWEFFTSKPTGVEKTEPVVINSADM